MGRRIDSADNEVVSVDHPDGRLAAEEAVFCPHDGDPDGDPPQGYATVDYAEQNWLEVDGQLCCSIYCAAKVKGLSEEQAQLARSAKTRADMRADGQHEAADADEQFVALLAREEGLDRSERTYPLAGYLADVATEDIAEHGIPDQAEEELAADQDLFEEIMRNIEQGEASEADEGGEE